MRQVMPKSFKSAALTGLAALAMAPLQAQAEEDDSGWFVGAGVGKADSTLSANQIETQLSGPDVTVNSVSVDDSRTGWKLKLGYEFSNHVAIEAGYLDLNDVNVQVNAVVTDPAQFFNRAKNLHPNSADGFTLGSSYQYHITDNFGLTGSVGLFSWEGDFNSQLTGANQPVSSEGTDGTDFYFGFGGGYKLTEEVEVSVGWERYKLDKDDADMWSIGLNYHFK